jgi:hypothetical protein
MKIIISRDGVHAGDNTREEIFEIHDAANRDEILKKLKRVIMFPGIDGGKATWVASSSIPIACFAQQWDDEYKLLNCLQPLERLKWENGNLSIHLSYFAQIDPNTVYDVLARLTL